MILKALDIEAIYCLIGGLLFFFSLIALSDKENPKKWGNALLGGLYGVTFAFGSILPAAITGVCAILMVVVVVLIGIKPGKHVLPSKDHRRADAGRLGLWLFFPFFVSYGLTLLLHWAWNVDILFAFGGSIVVVSLIGMLCMRESPVALVQDGQRMFDVAGWSSVLPQFLAALGIVFDAAGVDEVVLELMDSLIVIDTKLMAVVVYCVATAFFSMVMGNAFPAFLVTSSGIGIPVVVRELGADPAIAGVFAMMCGYCGTLMTPMSINFNTLPAELLGIRNINEVFKVQMGIALPLLLLNIVLMYFLAF